MGETIAHNRRARHEFSIEDTFEAGIVLRGTEIKSVRAHKVSLADAYARIERDEAWIIGLHIAPWESADVRFNHEPKRARKLLLHRGGDRHAPGQVAGQGPDDRARCGSTSTTRARRRSSSGSPGASRRGTGGARSPTGTRSGTWSARWRTRRRR